MQNIHIQIYIIIHYKYEYIHHHCSAKTKCSIIVFTRSFAIEMVFVFIATGHAGSSARSFMLSWFFLRLWVSDPVQSPVTKYPHLYLNCRRACVFTSKAKRYCLLALPNTFSTLMTLIYIGLGISNVLTRCYQDG